MTPSEFAKIAQALFMSMEEKTAWKRRYRRLTGLKRSALNNYLEGRRRIPERLATQLRAWFYVQEKTGARMLKPILVRELRERRIKDLRLATKRRRRHINYWRKKHTNLPLLRIMGNPRKPKHED